MVSATAITERELPEAACASDENAFRRFVEATTGLSR
jgi:hypothetical protein